MGGNVLRANYKRTGEDVDITGLGGGLAAGSWGGGSGTPRPFGGILVTSFASELGGPGASIMMSTYGLIETTYGSLEAALRFGSGFRAVPMGWWNQSQVPSFFEWPVFSVSAGDSQILVRVTRLSIDPGATNSIAFVSASGHSARFVFYFLIASGPGTPL